MAIDDNTIYGLSGAQIKDLPGKINAVKGLAKELTTDDYNWPVATPDGVAMWKLTTGIYSVASGTKIYVTSSDSSTSTYRGLFLLHNNGYQSSYLMVKGANALMRYWDINISGGTVRESFYIAQPVDNLNSVSEYVPLSANQGRVLKGMIDAITSFSYEVVQTLPASGENSKIYLLPIDESGGPADNIYEEYIWVDNAWEMIGTTEMDLTNYVQFSDLATVATSGSYADLNNKPTIPSVVQSAGSSTTDVMSQKATTWMIYSGGDTKKVQIGANSAATQEWGVAIFGNTSQQGTVAIGSGAAATARGAVALGMGANASAQGVFDIGLSGAGHSAQSNNGYNGSEYRLLSGLYDPQNAHDAATKGYVDNSIPATFTTNEWNALWA